MDLKDCSASNFFSWNVLEKYYENSNIGKNEAIVIQNILFVMFTNALQYIIVHNMLCVVYIGIS